jgi:hypothetical protein
MFPGDPYQYALGPEHQFFARPTAPARSPFENPAAPQTSFDSPLASRTQDFANNPSVPFDNPQISYSPVWGQAMLGAANVLGGPALSSLAGGLMGATMAQEAQNAFNSRGLGVPPGTPDVWGGALTGAARGALGVLGQVAGLTPGFSSLEQTYSAIPGIQGANDWGGLMDTIAANPQGTLSNYTVAGLAPEELGAMTNGNGGAPEGWGGGYGNPGAGDASFGMGETGNPDFGGADNYRAGGLVGVQELAGGGKIVTGPGGGLDDLIPTTIDGRRAARLSDGEFVIPADVVSMFGDGSTRAGSERLYDIVRTVRKEKTGTTRQTGQLPVGRILERIFG